MKKGLFILLVGLLSGQIFAQTKVSSADFARRPHYYQSKTILLENIVFSMGAAAGISENKNMGASKRANRNPSNTVSSPNHNEKIWSLFFDNDNPRCKELKGWTLIDPEIPGLNTPMCFAVMNKVHQRLPQKGMFKADIMVEIDVRGISQIKRLRIRK